MKPHLLLTLTLLSSTAVWSQNKNIDYKMALKVYNLATYEDAFNSEKLQDSSGLRYNFSNNTLMILHPTIAFQWKGKKNKFHEVELTSHPQRLMKGTLMVFLSPSTSSARDVDGV